MSKIGIRTGSLQLDLPQALETAGRLGYDGLEVITRDPVQLRGWLNEGGPGGAAQVRAMAERAKTQVSSFSLAIYRAVNFAQEDEAKRREGVELVSAALRACRNVGGVGGVAVLLPHFDQERLDVSGEEEERFAEGLRRVAPVAEETGVAIAIETSCSAAQLLRIVDAVGSPKVGVYQDLANAVIYGQDPAATVRALGPRIVMLHVKDTPGKGQAPLGEGVVDWAACRAAVREIGYDGWFVLETPPGDDAVEAASRYLDFTRRWLAS
jgi:sugar phosphate isomerase/epimerase